MIDYRIEIGHVTKRFRDKVVLDDVSAVFEPGKIHGIVGRNGSGKTVLFKCICGFLKPDSGSIRIGNIDRRNIPVHKLEIGAIIESPGFLPNYSGYSNLCFLAGIRHTIGKSEILQAMRTVGLDPSSRKHVGKYSMGMRQRLGIAQAIMEDPDLLILDEPFNGLDKQGVKEMRELMKGLRGQRKTILLASHNAQDIEELCDDVYEMDAGVLTGVQPGLIGK